MPGGWFSKAKGPLDEFHGEITHNGKRVCKIEGSWLNLLSFDGKIYWKLSKTSMFRPQMLQDVMPSDCRYREDSLEFGKGDMEKS